MDEYATARKQLSDVLEKSGLSVTEFARRVLGRDPRSLRRYLTPGEVIPAELADQLSRMHVRTSTYAIVITIDRK